MPPDPVLTDDTLPHDVLGTSTIDDVNAATVLAVSVEYFYPVFVPNQREYFLPAGFEPLSFPHGLPLHAQYPQPFQDWLDANQGVGESTDDALYRLIGDPTALADVLAAI